MVNLRVPICTRMLQYSGKSYHAECFACSECAQSLSGKSFVDQDPVRLCQECYKRHQEQTAPQCKGCGLKIMPSRTGVKCIKIGEYCYHSDCVICFACKIALTDTHLHMHDGTLYCSSHFKKANSS